MSVHRLKSLKSPGYQARWTDPSGRRRSKNFKTRASATHYEVEMRMAVRVGDYSDPQAGRARLRVVYEDWKSSSTNLKPKTRASYDSLWRCLVEPVWGARPVSGITRPEIKTWVSEARSSTGRVVSSSRIRQAFILLKILLDHAVDMNLVNRSPIQSGVRGGSKSFLPRIEISKEKRVLEKDELLALANLVGEYKSMVLVAGLLGIRWAELVALTPEDFNFKIGTISVSKSLSEINGRFELVTPKSGKARYLPMLDIIRKELKTLCLSTEKNSPIFTSPKGGYLRHSNFMRRTFAPSVKKAGIPKVTFHDLRHTAISQAIASRADVLAISQIAGHSSPSVTLNVYGHLLNDSMGTIQRALNSSYADSDSDRFVTVDGHRPA